MLGRVLWNLYGNNRSGYSNTDLGDHSGSVALFGESVTGCLGHYPRDYETERKAGMAGRYAFCVVPGGECASILHDGLSK